MTLPATGLAEAVSAPDAAENIERGERGRRRRRRGGRERDDSRDGVAANDASVADPDDAAATEPQSVTPDAASAIDVAPAGGGIADEDRGVHEGGARRRRGGRDRHRREERPADGETAMAEPKTSPDLSARMGEEAVDASAAIAQVEDSPLLAAATLPLLEPVATLVEPTPSIATVPAAPFALPTDELAAIAEGAGLEWVRSDAEKIRAAQQAIAAAPRPARVPRERKPAATVDQGPLVLVETRKDLSQVKLPFESEQRAT